jgi:hypothetical protein
VRTVGANTLPRRGLMNRGLVRDVSGRYRALLGALVASVAVLLLPATARAAAPMCDITAASVMVPGPVLPAQLVNGGEFRQGEPCPPPEFAPSVESGTTHDQRSDTSLPEAPPDAALCSDVAAVSPDRLDRIDGICQVEAPRRTALTGRVYRPPR